MAKRWDDMTVEEQLEFLRDTKADKMNLQGIVISLQDIGDYAKKLEKRIAALEK